MNTFWLGVLVGCGGCMSGVIAFGLAVAWWLDRPDTENGGKDG